MRAFAIAGIPSATGAEQFERLTWRDVKDKHWADIEDHLAPIFVWLDSGGTRDRTATVEYLKSLMLTDYTLGDFNTTSNGADLVVTYTARVRGDVPRAAAALRAGLHDGRVPAGDKELGGNRAQ